MKGVAKDEQLAEQAFDVVNKPRHYTAFGHECRDFSRHMHGAQCQAFQYIWRCDLKGEPVQDLEKAAFWLRDWRDNIYAGVYDLRHLVPVCEPRTTRDTRDPNCFPHYDEKSDIEKLREVCGHFGYNPGRALEYIFVGDVLAALELIEREIVARKQVAPVPAGTRDQRVKRAA